MAFRIKACESMKNLKLHTDGFVEDNEKHGCMQISIKQIKSSVNKSLKEKSCICTIYLPLYCTLTAPLGVLQSHDCLRSGPPDIGELIVVAMPNSQVVNASFVRSHTHIYYQVRFIPASFKVE